MSLEAVSLGRMRWVGTYCAVAGPAYICAEHPHRGSDDNRSRERQLLTKARPQGPCRLAARGRSVTRRYARGRRLYCLADLLAV